jgi:hypothetical protein
MMTQQGDVQHHAVPVSIERALVDEAEVGRLPRVASSQLVRTDEMPNITMRSVVKNRT